MQRRHTINPSVCHTLPLLCLFYLTLTLRCSCIVSCSRRVWFAACLTCSRRCYLLECLCSSHRLRRRPNKGGHQLLCFCIFFSNYQTPPVSPLSFIILSPSPTSFQILLAILHLCDETQVGVGWIVLSQCTFNQETLPVRTNYRGKTNMYSMVISWISCIIK